MRIGKDLASEMILRSHEKYKGNEKFLFMEEHWCIDNNVIDYNTALQMVAEADDICANDTEIFWTMECVKDYRTKIIMFPK